MESVKQSDAKRKAFEIIKNLEISIISEDKNKICKNLEEVIKNITLFKSYELSVFMKYIIDYILTDNKNSKNQALQYLTRIVKEF